MEMIIKTKYEYCHIDKEKIVITKALKKQDLASDYNKSINDFFKTLLVFFISIPIFSVLTVVFYHSGNFGISLGFGTFALIFLLLAFYLLLFTSGSPVIHKDKIVKIIFKKTLFFNVLEIKYKDFGRIKSREVILSNDQCDIDMALEILSTDKQIEGKIEYNEKQIDLFSNAFTSILIVVLLPFFANSKKEKIKKVN